MNRFLKYFIAMVLAFVVMPVSFTFQAFSQVPRVYTQTTYNYKLPVYRAKAVTADQDVEDYQAEVPQEIYISDDFEPVVMDEIGTSEQQQAPVAQETTEEKIRRLEKELEAEKLRQAQEKELLRKREEEGKKIQESVTPATNPNPPVTIEVAPETKIPGGQVMTRAIDFPAMCEDLNKILAAVDKIKSLRLSEGGVSAVNLFFSDLGLAKDCQAMVTKLEGYLNQAHLSMATIVPYSLEGGPKTQEIITNPKDYRLAAYGIGYGQPFKKWSESRVAKKELKTLQDYIENQGVLSDHIKFFTWDGHPELRQKVQQMKEEMPEVLDDCLHQSWRWAEDIKLCQWLDAAQAPLWVTTWASRTSWGRYYDLEKKRDAPMLVAYLPKSKEYVFWAGPCGGNGGWLPSGPKASFSTEVIGVECKQVTGSPLIFTSNDQKGNYEPVFGRGKDPVNKQDLEIRNSKWELKTGGTTKLIGNTPSIEFSPVQTEEGTSTLTYSGEARFRAEGGIWTASSCGIELVKKLPPPPPPVIIPTVLCESVSAVLEKDRVRIRYKLDGDTSLIKRTAVFVNNIEVPQVRVEKDGSLTIPDTIPEDDNDYVFTVAIYGENGALLAPICNFKGTGNTIRKKRPEASCKQVVVSQKKLSKKSVDTVIDFSVQFAGNTSQIQSVEFVRGNKVVAQITDVEAKPSIGVRAGDLLPVIQNKKGQTQLVPGSYAVTLIVRLKDGRVMTLTDKCLPLIKVTEDGKNKFVYVLVGIGVAALITYLVTRGDSTNVHKTTVPVIGR